MRKILKFFIYLFVLVVFGALVYKYQNTIRTNFTPLVEQVGAKLGIVAAPCSKPIPYNLGTFNTQFGISQTYFLSALSDAETIWEKPFGKNFFTYAPTDSATDVLKVDLIYDYRQQATSKLAGLGITVQDNRASYDMLKAKFTALKAQYDTENNAFNAEVQAFNQKQKAYEAEVNSWNAKGGAPQKEYDALQATGLALDTESKQLQATQNSINAVVDEINALVVVLNRLVATLNLSVDQYNTVNGSLGESFEEGLYSTDGTNSKIDIYEFSSRNKLVRVLAHELGHALGMQHVDDPKAIMYKLNQGTGLALTQADIDELKTVCGIK